ncbi:binding-protein-dependent transport systems inner membrane component [Paenibacillus vortex V453]|jgi:cellobiose transport system permease protein|uniref:Sugar ABC transporter permease n=2 Tax=Paenibacillus TaxID=44249 RepID=A0A163K423_9BACL|nr:MULTISPECIES: carbohydrate ABC transporter permease [Paenibacillus]ANA80959.1 sugar ABC transporter permease [Paenibacillus glucanolyticus]AVV54969.1 carbohydrate ABC transporter permease [Paenibacillus glucanolyticus]AWP29555.1 sugar ABC transporter permease [Paenibacillus sp. Cedars]EFU42561.1 binding-protein-dependent transport systems inner membrane component [Paenibacillus vortex V453]ETT36486.1 binding-protein-dependent transport systems inner membrane component [Paenibacillus sp. FSL
MSSVAISRKKPDEPGVIAKFFFYLLMILGALVSIFPFYWMFVVATNDKDAAFHIPPLLTPGTQFLDNFSRVLERTDFFRALLNSVVVSTSVTVSVVFLCTLAGYAFAKYEFPLKKTLFVFVIATMLVPAQLGVLPQYVIMAKLHWIDSYKALIVPAMVNAFGIFWMRQYITSAVHTELIEAGRIDGGGHFRIFWNIAIPVVTPAMATLGILNFMNVWNDFFWPLVVLKNRENYTIQIALQQLFTNKDGLDFGMIMSATFTATLPLLIVFLLFSRYVIAGLTSGAIKS